MSKDHLEPELFDLFVIARSIDRSVARSLNRSIDRSIALSLARSLARSIARSLARSLAHSIAPSLARSLDRSLTRSIIFGVQIPNYGYSGEIFGGSNSELMACIIFISPVSKFRITFQKNGDRTFLLFQGVVNC